MPEAIKTNTIIIGAGAAGLACAACLKKTGISYLILDQKQAVGQEWRNRYNRLHLHTPKLHSSLPYFKIPSEYPKYLSKDDFADYLNKYAEAFQLKPLFNQRVISVKREGEKYVVLTEDKKFISDHLIVASGYARKPIMPSAEQYTNFQGEVLHSSNYKSGAHFANKKVLVVGFGNSACEIAVCLHEHKAKPSLSVRNGVNIIPRQIAGISIVSIAIAQQMITKISPQLTDLINKPVLLMLYGDIKKLGLQKLPYGPITQITKYRKIPLLDIGTVKLIKEGKIGVFPGIRNIAADSIEFLDGRKENFDAIIFATGFEPGINDLLKGLPSIPQNGLGSSVNLNMKELPNLYFCGFNVTSTGMLRTIANEARQIAEMIAKKSKLLEVAG
jgi:cation diffusion facilitator CzcD-associated flavoprotein CzcO